MELIRKVLEVDDEEMEKYRIEFSEAQKVPMAFKRLHAKPAGVIAIEDFYPGSATQRFGLWYDEIIIGIKGKADVSCTSPKDVGIWETKTVTVEPGDCLFLYKGEQISFNALGETFRHLCIIMPQRPVPQMD